MSFKKTSDLACGPTKETNVPCAQALNSTVRLQPIKSNCSNNEEEEDYPEKTISKLFQKYEIKVKPTFKFADSR